MVENPQIDGWGGHVAAPAFRRVMERILCLPGGILVERAVRPPSVATLAVPDLRGMTRSVAIFQAEMRGLPVVFSGEGEVVVSQSPVPGMRGRIKRIECTLGYREVRGGWELRQARSMEQMPERGTSGI